jgi:hypothetical protein
MIASDELEGGPYDYTPGPFEPVELVDGDGGMYVEMMAIPGRQPADLFHWGSWLVPPEGQPRDIEKNDGINRRAIRDYQRMTPEQRAEFSARRKK